MIKFVKYRHLIKTEIIVTLFLFFLSIFSLLQFETLPAVKYSLLMGCALFLYFYFVKENIEFLIYPILYLIFFASYNLYYFLNWSLWITMLILIINLNIPLYLLINSFKKEAQFGFLDKYSQYFYQSFFSLIIIEIFLILIPWPTNPHGKSVILLIIFYILQGLTTAWINKKFHIKQLLIYFIIGILIISAIIITTPWYAY